MMALTIPRFLDAIEELLPIGGHEAIRESLTNGL
jgi:hypothetical protein